jgi:hypothetical protein
MAVYVEFPWDNVVGVHWKKKKHHTPNCHDDFPDAPRIILSPPLCGNTYSAGGIVNSDPAASIAPYGDVVEPFVGSFPTLGEVGPPGPNGEPLHGGLDRVYVDDDGNVLDETVAELGGGLVDSLRIDSGGLTFFPAGKPEVPGAVDYPPGPAGVGSTWIHWRVPMASGNVCRNLKAGLFQTDPLTNEILKDKDGQPIPLDPDWEPVPVVVDKITLDIEWGSGVYDKVEGDLYGIAISHVLLDDGSGGGAGPGFFIPAEPLQILGPAQEGSASFTYKLKQKTYDEWLEHELLLGHHPEWTVDNVFDPEWGGATFFLFMRKRFPNTEWAVFGDTFFPFTMIQGYTGDFFRWTATCTCVAYTEATGSPIPA